MTRKGLVLCLVLVALVTTYALFVRGWDRNDNIRIIRQIRPGRASTIERDPTSAPVYPVSFGFDQKCRLTSVKVVAAQDLATNKYPQELWHLISDTQSAPTKSIVYGKDIPGMKPSIPGRQPEPLDAQVEYVLLLETKSGQKGQTNFTTQAVRGSQ